MNNRVLVFIDWYRPGYKAGGPITSVANLVAHLKGDFSFHILTRDRDLDDAVPYPGIATDRWVETHPGGPVRVCYLSPERVNRKEIRKRAEEAGCSIWLVNGIYSWYFSILPLRIARIVNPGKVIVSSRGMLSPHALAQKGFKKRSFLVLSRLTGLYKGILLHANTPVESGEIKAVLGGGVNVRVAPNLPSLPSEKPGPSPPKEAGSIDLISLARISPEKNTLQAIHILSGIINGKISFRLAGAIGEEAYWNECQRAMESLPPNVSIHYEGALPPAELTAFLEKAHLLFLPTTGENYGHAILECLGHGVPVLISDRTPWNDLEEQEAGWVNPLDNEERFVRILESCLAMDQAEFDRKRENAFHYANRVCRDPQNMALNKALLST